MDEHVFYEMDLKCPVCSAEFTATKTKTKVKENMPIKHETYLLPVYPSERANPLSYEVDVCPVCRYSAFHNDFREVKSSSQINIARSFSGVITKLAKEADFNTIYRNHQLARLSYILAVYLYEQEKQRDLIKIGKCYIRIAWYSKELKEMEFYRSSLRRALDIYIQAYNDSKDDINTSAMFMYLISAVYIELGDYESALPFVSKLNADSSMRELPAIKQKLEELTADLRKRLKEIEEEMKPLSEEERRKARAARMEAVKTKQTAVPFGIELEKPNTDNMEIRVAPEKDILEEEYGIKLSGKPKVLIVDDSKVVRSTIKASLEGACDIVGLATNGSEAIQMYEVFRPDFVTLDLEMPGISGIETLKKIKQIDINAKIIIMTSRSESKFVMEALKNGAVAYLLKPAPKEKLLEIINKK